MENKTVVIFIDENTLTKEELENIHELEELEEQEDGSDSY